MRFIFFLKLFIPVVVVLSAIVNFLFLEHNNQLIREINPGNQLINAKALVYDQTIFSVDNEYYLSPVENYLQGNGWKRYPGVGNGDYFRRVPGYSLVYLFFVKSFGFPTGHLALKIFQLLLFLSTIPLVFYLAGLFSGKTVSRLTTILYAFVPYISSWAYFTLTESISPALMMFYVFFLFRAYLSENEKRKLAYYLFAALFFTIGVLTRPPIAIAGLALFIFTIRDYIYKKKWAGLSPLVSIWLIPFILISIWTIRNYVLTKEIVFLEKSVHPQTLDRMKPAFRGFWRFAKCWGEDGIKMNAYHDPLFNSALKGDTSSIQVNNFLAALPPSIIKEFGYGRLFDVVKRYQMLAYGYKPYVDSIIAMPAHFTPEELAVEKEFDNLVTEYRKKHFAGYWLKTPFIYLKMLIAHSNTGHLFFFQHENRGKFYVNPARYLLLAIHVFLYLSLFCNLFLMKGFNNKLVFVYIPLLFLFFFTVIHREIEQRYILPILPVIITGSSCTIQRALQVFVKLSGDKMKWLIK